MFSLFAFPGGKANADMGAHGHNRKDYHLRCERIRFLLQEYASEDHVGGLIYVAEYFRNKIHFDKKGCSILAHIPS